MRVILAAGNELNQSESTFPMENFDLVKRNQIQMGLKMYLQNVNAVHGSRR